MLTFTFFLLMLLLYATLFSRDENKIINESSDESQEAVQQVPIHSIEKSNNRLERDFTTKNGEAVYSGGEKEIADYLRYKGVNYEYEPNMCVGRTKFCPDFYIPKTNVFIEYLGMWDDPICQRKYKRKMAIYKNNNVNCIFLFPKHRGKMARMIHWYCNRDGLKVF